MLTFTHLTKTWSSFYFEAQGASSWVQNLYVVHILLTIIQIPMWATQTLSLGRPKLDMSDLIDSNDILRYVAINNYWIRLSMIWRIMEIKEDFSG